VQRQVKITLPPRKYQLVAVLFIVYRYNSKSLESVLVRESELGIYIYSRLRQTYIWSAVGDHFNLLPNKLCM